MIPHAFNQSELLARGWTLRRITVFLGLPDYMAQGRTRPYCNSATLQLRRMRSAGAMRE